MSAPRVGLILFGHGARDPQWADTMRALALRISQLQPDLPVELAFLEFLEPPLPEAAARLAAAGARRIVVAPVFLAGAGHVLRDLPQLLAQARERCPQIEIEVLDPLGRHSAVIEAMARICIGATEPR